MAVDRVSVVDNTTSGDVETPQDLEPRPNLVHHVNLRIDSETLSALRELSRRWGRPLSEAIRETIRRGLTTTIEPTTVGVESVSSPRVVFHLPRTGHHHAGYISHTTTGERRPERPIAR